VPAKSAVLRWPICIYDIIHRALVPDLEEVLF
jgi:hypothetical protein